MRAAAMQEQPCKAEHAAPRGSASGPLPATDVSSGHGSMAGKKGGEQRHRSTRLAEGTGAMGWQHSRGGTPSSPTWAWCSRKDEEISPCMAATPCPPSEPLTEPPTPHTQHPSSGVPGGWFQPWGAQFSPTGSHACPRRGFSSQHPPRQGSTVLQLPHPPQGAPSPSNPFR